MGCTPLGVVFVSALCGLCVAQANDRLVTVPSSRSTVTGGTVNMSCSSIVNQAVNWTRDGFFVCRTNFTKKNTCHPFYGPSNSGGTTNCDCNSYKSDLTITNVTLDDAKNWTCTSQTQTKRIQLSVLNNSVPTAKLSVITLRATTRATTTTTKDPFPKPGTLTSALSDHTSARTAYESAGISSTPGPQTISSTETWLDMYKTYIVVGAVVGGVVLLVIVVVVAVVKTRKTKSGTDKKTHKQRLVKDETAPSQDEELEAITASAGVYSVVQKKGDNSPDCADIYAKPDKTKKSARGDSEDV